MPYQRLARHVLDEWREVERQLSGLDPKSADAARLRAMAGTLRQEYQHLVHLARVYERPIPPPFPGDDSRGESTPKA
ncbi:MAG TPA: hypothetical protein VKR24_00775 [Candidatus Limnocylindrales bacterium]|nr:hypothetical protein [Candidatus Limnocylindrales bacterium]